MLLMAGQLKVEVLLDPEHVVDQCRPLFLDFLPMQQPEQGAEGEQEQEDCDTGYGPVPGTKVLWTLAVGERRAHWYEISPETWYTKPLLPPGCGYPQWLPVALPLKMRHASDSKPPHERGQYFLEETMKLRNFLMGMTALAFSAAVAAQQPIVIKFSHVVAKETPKGKASDFFAKRAEELTKGKVKVEVYANSTLYKDKEEMEALQLGAVQMLAPSLAKFGPLGVKEFEVFDLPFIFDNYAELHKITQGSVGKQLMAKLEPKGIKGLAYWDNGFKSMSANKQIKAPEDFKGLKMRIQSSKVLESQMRSVGALPQVMAFSEVYQALQTGVVDGTENPHSNLYTQKMHEVQKHMTLTDHGYLGYAVITNKKFWEGLPADVRGQLEQAMKESTDYANKIAKEENDQALEKVKASGKTQIYTPTAAERMAIKKAMMKTHKEMESRIGKEIIESVYKETGFDPSKL
jgi:C4-dicarboxylate-binding protein DctP